jgi:hypothetical protein
MPGDGTENVSFAEEAFEAVCAMPHTHEPGLTGDRHDMRFRPRRLAVSKYGLPISR